MSAVTDAPRTADIIAALTVEPAGEDHFTGECYPAWPGRAFGGQLAALGLAAAAATISGDLTPWSLHIHFHAPVAARETVDFSVRRIKDGRTVASREVAVEQDGRLRATVLVLFGAPAAGPTHQYSRPDVVPAELLASEERLLHTTIVPPDADADALGYPAQALIEMRVITPAAPDDTFQRQAWLRIPAPMPTDPLTVAATLCCFADLTLGTTALEPHGGRAATVDLQLGALELALWFTAGAQLAEWTLFSQDSAFAGGGHGLAHGVFYNSQGEVCAVALQNALMRER